MDAPAFERARLRVARELVGFSQNQLANLVDLSPAAISQFESGTARPSLDTLSALSDALRVPVPFFAQPLSDTHEGFFRSLRRTAVSDRRRARSVAHIAHDLATAAASLGEFPLCDVPQIPVRDLAARRADVEDVARQVRREWRVPSGPIRDVTQLLEDHGVAVIRLPLDSTDVDAFSLPFADHPVVVLGSEKDDRARSRFDCAHELGHLVMHGEQIWGVKEVETQAHQFAAGFLMPEEEIRDQLPTTVDWPRLFELKQQWQVSLAALLMRAKVLECMSPSTYLTAIKGASARGWRRREPVPLGSPEQPRLMQAFLATTASRTARRYLPEVVVDNIATASHGVPRP